MRPADSAREELERRTGAPQRPSRPARPAIDFTNLPVNRYPERALSISDAHAIARWSRRSPRPDRLSVYLAGKISKNDWRRDWAGTNAGVESFSTSRLYASPFHNHEHLRLVGPFFTSCGHGCSHSLNHAMFADESGGHFGDFDCTSTHTDGGAIASQCIDWINQADIVIAVVDDDAHGTIFEMGHAAARGIPVIALPGNNYKEAWFPLAAPGVRHSWGDLKDEVDSLNQAAARYKQIDRCASPIERMFFECAWKLGTLTRFGVNVPVLDGKYRIDFADVERKIGIELDGHAYHSDKDQFEQDRVRQRELEGHGWRFIRFAGREVTKDVSRCVLEASKRVRELSA